LVLSHLSYPALKLVASLKNYFGPVSGIRYTVQPLLLFHPPRVNEGNHLDLDAGAGFEPAPLAYETSMLDQTAIPRNNLAVTKGFEPSIFGVTGRRFDRTKLRHYWGDGRDLNPRR
jgi:hypothetical protein